MKNYRKILAGILATSMVFGSSTAVFAAGQSGQTKGSGKVEGQAKQEVFSVVLPTESEYSGVFDYVLDPMGLINGAEGNKFDSNKYDFTPNTTVFFYNGYDTSTPPKMKYSNKSDELTVVNKSSMPIDLTVSLKASKVDGITLTNATPTGSDTSLYLALEGQKYTKDVSGAETADAAGPDTKAVNSNGVAALSVNLAGITATGSGEKAFIVQWNPIRNGYEYVENTDAKAPSKTTTLYKFKVTGECNADPSADWLDILQAGDTPELEIVWSIEDPTGAQIDSLNQTTKTIEMSGFTSEQTYKSITVSDGTETHNLAGTLAAGSAGWDETTQEGSLTFTYDDGWKAWMKDKLVTITLNLTDGSSRTITFVGE